MRLLIEQQLEVFLAAVLIGGAGLQADQALLFQASTFEGGLLLVQALQLGLAAVDFLLQGVDLLFQLAHLAFGGLQLFLDAGFLLLDLLEQLLQFGDVLAGGFDLLARGGALVRPGRAEQAEKGESEECTRHGGLSTEGYDRRSMPKKRTGSLRPVAGSEGVRPRLPAGTRQLSSTMERPVISCGTGMPSRVSMVGATSASTPPSRIETLRLPI